MLSSVKYTIDLIYGYTGIEIAAGKVLLVLMGVGISSLLLVMALILMLLRKFTGSSEKPNMRKKTRSRNPSLRRQPPLRPKRLKPRVVFSLPEKERQICSGCF